MQIRVGLELADGGSLPEKHLAGGREEEGSYAPALGRKSEKITHSIGLSDRVQEQVTSKRERDSALAKKDAS